MKEEDIKSLGVETVQLSEGFNNLDVLIIANNHDSYKDWYLHDLISKMNKPAIIYDGWRMLDKEIIESEEIKYLAPGL